MLIPNPAIINLADKSLKRLIFNLSSPNNKNNIPRTKTERVPKIINQIPSTHIFSLNLIAEEIKVTDILMIMQL